MTDKFQLQQMSEIDITQADHSTLADIRDIRIDGSLPPSEKMRSFIQQIGNPYCFLCGDTPVKIRFADGNKTLEQCLCRYFRSLK